ncbi:MAG: hypothetical protein ACYCT2_09065 [Thermoplasmataceae archaeon]
MTTKFDKLSRRIEKEYERKGMSTERAKEISAATAGKIAREKEDEKE